MGRLFDDYDSSLAPPVLPVGEDAPTTKIKCVPPPPPTSLPPQTAPRRRRMVDLESFDRVLEDAAKAPRKKRSAT